MAPYVLFCFCHIFVSHLNGCFPEASTILGKLKDESTYLAQAKTSLFLQTDTRDDEKLETGQRNHITDPLTSKQCSSTCSQHCTLERFLKWAENNFTA